ncbi:hypothetical protein HHK36_017434 [Tetracentron sinense]|uniref:Uncharacterized protein n=1 Tax=Tetracentron sinense TaxID=13715 RepID=A0A834Z378_TETSI|nr:hypothetical protein HHK36_017434 [Tetracentron sinense]
MPLSFSSPFHHFSLDLFFPMFFLSGKHLTPASVSLTSIFFIQFATPPQPPSAATRPSPPVRGSNFASVHPFRLFQLRPPLSPASSISMVTSRLLQPSSPSNTSSLLR